MPEQQEVVAPQRIVYTGGLADEHYIASEDLAASIQGASKISTALAHYVFTGKVPQRNFTRSYRCITRAPAAHCYDWTQYVVAIAPGLIDYAPAIREGASFLFDWLWDALLKVWTSEKEHNFKILAETMLEADKNHSNAMLEAMKLQAQVSEGALKSVVDMAVRHEEVLERLISRLTVDLPVLARTQHANAVSFVEPVGRSCDRINSQIGSGRSVVVDVTGANIIRAQAPEDVGSEEHFQCTRITELNLNTGHCILTIVGFEESVPGQISDPVLKSPNNVYTAAMNEHRPLVLTGKRVSKNGEVIRIHVSDAN